MPVKGKTSKLLSLGLNAAQHTVHKAANFLDKLAADPSAPQSSSSNQPPNYHAPPYGMHPYPSGAPTAPPFYESGVPPPPPPPSYPPGASQPPPHPPPPPPPLQQSSIPQYTASPHYEPHPSYTSPPPPPPGYSSSAPPQGHRPTTSYPAPSYPAHSPSYAHGASVSAPSLHPPAACPSPTPTYQEHHPSYAHGASTSAPSLYPFTSSPPSSSHPPGNSSFSPSAPPQTPPPGYPQPPQSSHPPSSSAHNVTSSIVHHSSSAPLNQQEQLLYPTSRPQYSYASAPDLPSPEYNPHPPTSSAPNRIGTVHLPPNGSQQAAAVHYPHPAHHRPASRPISRHDPIEEGLDASPSSPNQPAPEGYPRPPPETDTESYHTASAPPQSPFYLPSPMAGTPAHKYSSPSVPYSGTPSASEGTTPPSPSNASTCQMSCAGFNIVPVQIQRPSETHELFMDDLLEEAYKRQVNVVENLGKLVFDEACKGLSRVLDPADETDIQLFGIQLRRSDYAACEQHYHRCARDNVPIFAISYVHRNRSVGRYDFSDDQWQNFKVAMSLLAKSNIQKVRVWLDQCLWLRDSNQGCWAHTGMIPYVIWPVFSLGVKVPEKDRTFDSFDRVWPYLEEIAGLWSMGMITTSELHQDSADDDVTPVTHIRYNLRKCLAPQVSLYLLFHAITDGKICNLSYGCEEDVHELMDMARFNMDYESDQVVVGSNWRSRASPVDRQNRASRFRGVSSSAKSVFITSFASGEVYLDN